MAEANMAKIYSFECKACKVHECNIHTTHRMPPHRCPVFVHIEANWVYLPAQENFDPLTTGITKGGKI